MTTIAVLAGGASQRMGSDKASFELAGRTMAEWVIEAASIAGTPLIAGRADGFREVPGVADPIAGRPGPLAGLVAALRAANGDDVVLVAVDQPWVRPATLQRVIGLVGDVPVVPRHEERRQVLCAAYPAAILDAAALTLETGGSIQDLLDGIGLHSVAEDVWRSWGEDGRSWFSVDTPEAAAAGLERFGVPT